MLTPAFMRFIAPCGHFISEDVENQYSEGMENT